MKSIFEYNDYKSYLNQRIQGLPARGHGERTKLAEFIPCHRPFISQVLSADAHFSLEQAERVCFYFSMTEEETEFFILLVLYNRAGSKKLELHFKRQVESIRKKRTDMAARVKATDQVPLADQEEYFSSWLYQVIQVMLSMDQFQDRKKIAHYLRVEEDRVAYILSFLEKIGLVNFENGNYTNGKKRIHLDHSSVLINKFHYNWRLQALNSLDNVCENDGHYSACFPLSEKDVLATRKELLDLIERLQKRVSKTEPEAVYSFCYDIFKI